MRAIVIKPDGTAVFDAGLHPDHRKLMIADLVEMGHSLTVVDEPHPMHQAGQVGASHAILHTGPHSADGQIKARAEAARQAGAKPARAAGGGKAQ